MTIDNATLHAMTTDILTGAKAYEATQAAEALQGAEQAAARAAENRPSFLRKLILSILSLGIYAAVEKLTHDDTPEQERKTQGRQVAETLTSMWRELQLFTALSDEDANGVGLGEHGEREAYFGRERVLLVKGPQEGVTAFIAGAEEGVVIEDPGAVMRGIEDLIVSRPAMREYFDPEFVNQILQTHDAVADIEANPSAPEPDPNAVQV
ncbi:MAG: hypothetical protein SPJ12_08970 [Duodenibacillus sp.]|nr:hypothetical protein [Duodenibacillus sp.]